MYKKNTSGNNLEKLEVFRMLNKKSSFKQFMKGNGFYILTGVSLIAIVTAAMILPKKGEGNVAEQPDKYAVNRPATAGDISDLRVPTIDPRLDQEDLAMDEDSKEMDVAEKTIDQEDLVVKATEVQTDEIEEELVSETFSSTTTTKEELFHADNDLFQWPLENQIIYSYSDNDQGRSFMNPTLDRTMRSFGLFIKAEEDTKVRAAALGRVLSIIDYPTAGLSSDMDYPQVGTAVIIDHGNDWKTVYGLHQGQASVEEGDMVHIGDTVGLIGKPSKDFSLTGTNLYFQVLKNDIPMDPEKKLENR